jgi:tyrosinase
MARRNVYNLTATEWTRVASALKAIKANGVYDDFTRRHVAAMMELTLMAGETGTSRNVAHRGPAFLAWHRRALRELELELQRVDGATPALELPYWRSDQDGTGWRTAPIWSLVGGDGDSTRGWRIQTGPFKDWVSIIYSDGSFRSRSGIVRQFATSGSLPGPFSSRTYGITAYDVSPWNESSSTASSFRAQIEGAHNTVHNQVGGDMRAATSPNDPLFWLHHCNYDRIWAEWQVGLGKANYQPGSGGPPGHNVSDTMKYLLGSGVTPGSTLDHRAMGYTYDTVG